MGVCALERYFVRSGIALVLVDAVAQAAAWASPADHAATSATPTALAVLAALLVGAGGLVWGAARWGRWRADAEAARRRSELLQAVLDTMPSLVFVKDPEGRYLLVNPPFERFVGRTREEILGRTDRDLFPPDEAERSAEGVRRVMETNAPTEGERTLPGKDGPHVFRVNKFPLRGSDGATWAVGGVATDITELRRLAATAVESERRFRNVVEHSTNLFFAHTPDHVVTYISPQSRDFLGCEPEEAMTRWTEFVTDHPVNRQVMENTERAIRTGKRQPPFEAQLLSRDGRTRWVEIDEAPVVRDGRVVEIVGAITDIDERKRAEEGLRRALSQLEATLEATEDGILVVDLNGRAARYNRRFLELWHLPADIVAMESEEAIVARVAELLDDPRAFREGVARLVAHPEAESFDELHFTDGRVFERYSRPQRIGGEVAGRVWSFRDVTARRRIEERLSTTNATLRAIIDASPVAILTLDMEGRVRTWSAAAEAIFGWSEAEVVGRRPPMVKDDAVAEYDAYREFVVKEGGSVDTELLRQRKDGTDVVVHFRSAPIRGAHGEIVGVVSLLADVTARRRDQEELRRHRDHLAELVAERTREMEAANRELESFSYTVSHDLRAPLRAIDGFGRLLEEETNGKLDAVAAQHLARIRAATARMGRLIDDLLELSRVTRRPIHREPIDLTALARSVEAELRADEPNRDVELRVEEGLVADGDAALLRSLLQNVLSNAWKFTSKRAHAHIAVGARWEGGERVYFVRDDGAGFDPTIATHERLFAPFQRFHPPSEFEGTGIGLATAERIVRRHGGRIWAEAAVDQGATFYFTLGKGGEEGPRGEGS